MISHSSIKWLVTIVDRGKGEEVIKLCKENHSEFNLIILGVGTASRDIMNYLGLDEPEKDIVISLVINSTIKNIFEIFKNNMHFLKPGKGICFTISLSAMSTAICYKLNDNCNYNLEKNKETIDMKENNKYDLLVCIVNHGESDIVMEVAKGAGATGGTSIRARSLDSDEVEKFFKLMIQPEKDVVLLIVQKEVKHNIMQEICDNILYKTHKKGIVFSLPIDEVIGINSANRNIY